MSFLLSLLTLGATGCVIPPSLEVEDQDAGLNSPPAIMAVRSDAVQVIEPGPLQVVRGPTAGPLSVEILDTDLADQLFVRIFVNYTIEDPMPARSGCVAAPGALRRSCAAELTALCTMADVERPDDDLPLMTVKVFDRAPEEVGDPPYQSVLSPGLSAGQTFKLRCTAGPTT